MIVVAWNMGRRDHRAAWRYLPDDLAPDLGLLQETVPPNEASQWGCVLHARAYAEHSWGSAVYVRGGAAHELPLPPEHRAMVVSHPNTHRTLSAVRCR